ncbi:MAG: VWA domain-containing protein [Nannocystaceae bacterium]
MRTSHMIYIGAALTSLMCGTLIANQIWPIPQPTTHVPTTAASAQTQAQPEAPLVRPEQEQRPRIDVVFVVDTTGSMGGLLDGAKRKIWSIANRLASGQPRPDIRVGLVAFRDLNDEYVTRNSPLTRDLDGLQGDLNALAAGGGGDGPEHVNQGLADAIHGMAWEQGDNVLRLVFLVGDAPPHDDYAGPSSSDLAAAAKAKGIVINTIRCGQQPETAAAWTRIAQLAGGEMSTIDQDGGVDRLDSPFDAELAELNRSLAATSLGWGSATDKARAHRKVRARSSLSGEAAADAASYSAKTARLNDEDLLSALDEGRVELERVANEALPENMQRMSTSEQQAYVADLRRQREALNKQILEVAKKRDAWVEDNSGADGFDNSVVDMLRSQAADIGVAY